MRSSEARNVQFKVRLSPEEHDALKRHAAWRGLDAADVVRQFIRSLPEFGPEGSKKRKKRR